MFTEDQKPEPAPRIPPEGHAVVDPSGPKEDNSSTPPVAGPGPTTAVRINPAPEDANITPGSAGEK